jgi:hypothetical protein
MALHSDEGKASRDEGRASVGLAAACARRPAQRQLVDSAVLAWRMKLWTSLLNSFMHSWFVCRKAGTLLFFLPIVGSSSGLVSQSACGNPA